MVLEKHEYKFLIVAADICLFVDMFSCFCFSFKYGLLICLAIYYVLLNIKTRFNYQNLIYISAKKLRILSIWLH